MATTSTGLLSGISRSERTGTSGDVRREQAGQRAARDRRGDDGEAAALGEQGAGDLADRLDDALLPRPGSIGWTASWPLRTAWLSRCSRPGSRVTTGSGMRTGTIVWTIRAPIRWRTASTSWTGSVSLAGGVGHRFGDAAEILQRHAFGQQGAAEAASAARRQRLRRQVGGELRRDFLERVEQLLRLVHAEQIGGGGLDDLVEMGGDDGGRIDHGIAGDHRLGALRRARSRPRRGRRSGPCTARPWTRSIRSPLNRARADPRARSRPRRRRRRRR